MSADRGAGPAEAPDPATVASTLRELAVAAFASAMSMRVCDAMLPQMADRFSREVTDLAGVVTAFAIAYGLFSLVHGPLGDRRGKLPVIALATAIAALGSLACWVAWSPQSLIAFRFLTGAVCAAIIPLSLAWIGDSVGPEARQQTLARFAAAPVSGLIAGQVVGGVFADVFGWRSAFLVPAALFGIAGLRLAGIARRPGAARPVASPVGVFAGYLALLRNPRARFLMAAVAVEGACAFGVLAFVPSYLHERFGVALWLAGLLVAAYGLGGLMFAARAGPIIARLGAPVMSMAGGFALATGFAVVALSPWWFGVALGCMCAGFGFNMLHNTLQTAATQAHPEARGTAIAGFALCLFLGQSLGVALAAAWVEAAGYPQVFAVLALTLAVLGSVVRFRSPR